MSENGRIESRLSRTRASRPFVKPDWVALLILAGSGIGAAFMTESAAVVAAAIIAGGGLLAGIVLGWRGPMRSRIQVFLTPGILLVITGVLSVAFGDRVTDPVSIVAPLALAFVLWEVFIAIGYSAVLARRTGEEAVHVAAPLGRELESATRHGTIPLVVREYVDDDEGKRHLDADTGRLIGHGYEPVSVERNKPRLGETVGAGLAILLGRWGDAPEPMIVASFRLRSWNGPADFAFTRGEPQSLGRSLSRLVRDVLIVAAWFVGVVSVVIAASLVLTQAALGEEARSAGGLAMLVLFCGGVVLGPYLTIRRLDQRGRDP